MAATWTTIGKRSVRSVQAATEAAPTQATDGFDLDGLAAVTFWLDAGAGQTITAETGGLNFYQYDGSPAAWGLAPAISMAVPPGSTGQRRVQMGTVPIDNPRGRLAPIAASLTVSGATVTIEAFVTGLKGWYGGGPI